MSAVWDLGCCNGLVMRVRSCFTPLNLRALFKYFAKVCTVAKFSELIRALSTH